MSLIQGKASTGALVDVLVDATGQVYVVLAAVPLPAGASTEATQLLVKADLDSLKAALASVASDKLRVTLIDALPAGTNVIGHVIVDSSALPSGAATETTLADVLTKLTSLSNALATVASDKLRVSVVDALPAGTNVLGHVILDAGTATIGRVQVRNSTDAANIDPLAETTFTGRIGEVQATPTQYTVLDRLKALLTGIVLAAGANRIGKVTVRNSADGADIDPLAEATFTGRIGEVQATPTANTVLDRLKQLLTGIVLAAGSAVIGKVDINSAPTLVVQSTNSDKVWGYESQVDISLSNLSAAAGTNNLDTTTVPTGKVWVITHVSGVDINSATTKVSLSYISAAGGQALKEQAPGVAAVWTIWDGVVYLAAGDYLRGNFTGCTLNDDIYFRVNGYQMDAT